MSIMKEVVGAFRKHLARHTDSARLKEQEISLQSPNNLPPGTRLSVFLYTIEENPDMKNTPPSYVNGIMQRPSLYLDMYFIITAHAANQADELLIIEAVMQAIYDHPEIECLSQTFRITPYPLGMERLHSLWRLFGNQPYKLSLLYLLSPVEIPSKMREPAYPVISSTYRVGRLFKVPKNYLENLQQGEITADLRRLFDENGYALSQEAHPYLFQIKLDHKTSKILQSLKNILADQSAPLELDYYPVGKEIHKLFEDNGYPLNKGILKGKFHPEDSEWLLLSHEADDKHKKITIYSLMSEEYGDTEKVLRISLYPGWIINDIDTQTIYRIVRENQQLEVYVKK